LNADAENLFAISFAAVVQSGILLASAYLFRLLLKRRPLQSQQDAAAQLGWLPVFVGIILLLLLPISIVFSYGARLEWQIGPEQKATIQASGAHGDATRVLNALSGMMAEEGQRRSTGLTNLPDYRAWIADMDRLTKSVAYAPDSMRAYLRSNESAEAENRALARRRQAQASQLTLDFDRQADQIKKSLEAIEAQIQLLAPLTQSERHSTAELDARIAQYEAEMQKEKNGTGSCGPAGEGACFRRHKADRDKAARERSLVLENAAASRRAADRITALTKEKIEKEAELTNIIDKARVAGHEIEIDPLATSLDVTADLPKKIAALQSTVGRYGIELRKAIDELNNGFTPDRYSRVSERCQDLLPITMIGDLKETFKRLACKPAALVTPASSIEEFEERERRFTAECRSLPFYGGSGSVDAYTSQLFDKVVTCIESSGLGTTDVYRQRVADLSQELSTSKSNRSTGVDYLTFTTGELRDGKRVAFLALAFAIAVDALVLAFTFLGELPRLSTTTASLSLSSEERRSMYDDFQAVNDALDTSVPSRFRVARAMLACLEAGLPDNVIRLNFGKLANEGDGQALLGRLIPSLAAGLAWSDPHKMNVLCMSERALSLLAQECRRVIAREESQSMSAPDQQAERNSRVA
jgi:hypothetical protein